MAFSVEDMLERLGVPESQIKCHEAHECYREEAASIKISKREELSALFPNVTLSESKEIVYAPFRLCHSLPKINLRGRCFTPTTLANSFGTARDALVNIDHQMAYRKGARGDTICGHIVCGRFDPDGLYVDEIANRDKFVLPKEAIPMLALAAFHLRSQYVPKFLEEHLSGERKWHTSMECSRNIEQDNFYYRGQFVPVKDAEDGMRECVTKLAVRPFKGYPLALAVGGLNGKVDFHSAALTPSPADDDAKFMAFVTKDEYVEAANTGGSTFFFPLETKLIDEDANPTDPADMEEELANISILGKTHPTEDGHVHDVLSDGTVVPKSGHAHHLDSFSVTRGTNPKFTGKTSTHTKYLPQDGAGPSREHSHMHLISIPLRGKGNKELPPSTSLANTESETYQEPWVFSILGEQDMTTKPSFNDVMGRFGRILGGLKLEGQAQTEVASLRSDLEALSRDEFVKSAVKTELANLVASGELVEKAKHEEAIKAVTKAEAEKAEAAKKEAEARTARREKVLALGLDMDAKFNDKLDTTVGEFINTFALDDVGNKAFSVALATLETVAAQQKQIVELNKPAETTATPATTTAKEVAAGEQTTAASTGKKPVTPGEKKEKIRKMVLVGAGGGEEETEEGSAGTNLDKGGNKGAKTPQKGVGRGIFSQPLEA
jgi:hypothetical protein